MSYLSQLTENEIQYICSVMPIQEAVQYFKQNPKDFMKIMPGFRPTGINQEQLISLLLKHRNQPFISSFIEKRIEKWLGQIENYIKQKMEDNNSKENALLQTLPLSFFVDNISLYFKLTKEEYPEEYLLLLNEAIKIIKAADIDKNKMGNEIKSKDSEINILQKKLENIKIDVVKSKAKLNKKVEFDKNKIENEIKSKDSEIKTLYKKLENQKSDMKKSNDKINGYLAEIKTLKNKNTILEKLKTIIGNNENDINSKNNAINMLEDSIKNLKSDLEKEKNIREQLEIQIQNELTKKQEKITKKQEAAKKPLSPKDMNEFKDFLGYNLENIGIATSTEYYSILKEHLSNILFQGVPILVNRNVGFNLIKCVSNTLNGIISVNALSFKEDLSVQAIDEFLSLDERIVCLDNFIGNFNETELLPLFDNHKDKIIFFTVAYDRTVYCVSTEFMKYCYYLNLNRIIILSGNNELTEDPSTIDEEVGLSQKVFSDSRYSLLLKEMLNEFGFHRNVTEKKCSLVSSEQDLCQVLAFDVLPFCVDVLKIAPYNTSERFVKYAGDTGRCQYKNLFKEWFA